MSLTEQIILIVLAAALAIFLLLAVIIAAYAVQVLRIVRRVVTRAEHIATNIEFAGETLSRASGPLALLKVVNSIVKSANKRK